MSTIVGPMVRLAKAVADLRAQFVDPESPDYELEVAKVVDAYDSADLAGPCGTCGGSGELDRPDSAMTGGHFSESLYPCPTCNGTGSDPLAAAREADRRLTT